MPATYASFVAAFPEFADFTAYPQSQVNFWLPIAYEQLNAYRFGALLDLAAMLFTAHNVVLSAREAASASGNQIVGAIQGPITSKTIGKVSVGYSSDTALPGAGAWNFTVYGQRLYNLMRAYGSGPVYVRGCSRFSPWR